MHQNEDNLTQCSKKRPGETRARFSVLWLNAGRIYASLTCSRIYITKPHSPMLLSGRERIEARQEHEIRI